MLTHYFVQNIHNPYASAAPEALRPDRASLSVSAKQRNLFSSELSLTGDKHRFKIPSSSCFAPMKGQPNATASYPSAASNSPQTAHDEPVKRAVFLECLPVQARAFFVLRKLALRGFHVSIDFPYPDAFCPRRIHYHLFLLRLSRTIPLAVFFSSLSFL